MNFGGCFVASGFAPERQELGGIERNEAEIVVLHAGITHRLRERFSASRA
jgi:hypothetical protein